ncbi:MAG: prolyl oligopeptidase family serine peptidase [Mucilaginibacter polytrichastri]|nr:prolyl oligopeptidase family serine peptidase [Mucilaginibacter polytrichastri]
MSIRFTIILFIGLLFPATIIFAQEKSPFEQSSFTDKGATLPYRILFPKNFNPTQKYPMLVFLHGAGERGNDNEKQLVHGGSWLASDSVREKFPMIVIVPQCPENDFWSNVKISASDSSGAAYRFDFQPGGEPTTAMSLLSGLLEKMLEKPYVDKRQIYVGGLSMGGMGTLELLRRKPKVFAAAFAICGGDNTGNVKAYRRTPVWLFHGAVDRVVPVDHSRVIAQALQAAGDEVYLTIYPETDHNSWDKVFIEPKLLPWLFSKKK